MSSWLTNKLGEFSVGRHGSIVAVLYDPARPSLACSLLHFRQERLFIVL